MTCPRLLERVISWRLQIEEGDFINWKSSKNNLEMEALPENSVVVWDNHYLAFNLISQKDLTTVCFVANTWFEKIGSPLRVNHSMGEIIPSRMNGGV